MLLAGHGMGASERVGLATILGEEAQEFVHAIMIDGVEYLPLASPSLEKARMRTAVEN